MASLNLPSFPQLTAVDRNSYIPYYAQVKEALKELLESQLLASGDQIPGEAELCQAFGVSRTVIRQALDELEYEGLIVREQGKGTFVAEPKISGGLAQRLTGWYQDMVAQGYSPVSKVLKQELVPANPKVAASLHVEVDAPVIEITRLRFVQGEPIVLVTTYLPAKLCSQVLQADLSSQSLYAFLESHCGLVLARGHRTLEAALASEHEARLLQVRIGAPLIRLESVSYLQDGTPLEYYSALHRGDRTRFEVELVRVEGKGEVVELLRGP
jgi:GntR family transcriptional regulator